MKKALIKLTAVISAAAMMFGAAPLGRLADFSTVASAEETDPIVGTSQVKTIAELNAQYDGYVYIGSDIMEYEEDGVTKYVSDGYVQPGDILAFRMYLKSDMYLGPPLFHILFDHNFFSIKNVNGCSNAYPAITAVLNNPDYDLTSSVNGTGRGITSSLSGGVCSTFGGGAYLNTNRVGMTAAEVADWDVMVTATSYGTACYPTYDPGHTTATNYMELWDDDDFFLEWDIEVLSGLASGTTGWIGTVEKAWYAYDYQKATSARVAFVSASLTPVAYTTAAAKMCNTVDDFIFEDFNHTLTIGDPCAVHTPVTDPAVAPTCTQTGLTEGLHCPICDVVLVAQTVIPATGHTIVIDTAAVAATCTETGLTEGSHCSVCNAVISVQTVIPALLEYKVADGMATITRCSTSASGAITIPSTLGGSPVTSIGDYAFLNCDSLTSINIPEGVTSIGNYAFLNCDSLTSINISASVTSIGYSAFNNCSSLTSVNIPEGVTGIGYRAFFNCSTLTSINIPASVTSIGYQAFCNTAYCKNAANWTGDLLYIDNCLIDAKYTLSGSYDIIEGTRLIADSAFNYCTSLTSINIPEGVTSIGGYAFEKCTALESVTFDEGSQLKNIGGSAFIGCNSLASINIPEGVTSIGVYAFSYCTSLVYVHIPSSVTTIGWDLLDETTAYICSDTEDCYAKEYATANSIQFVLCAEHCPICGASWEFEYTIDTPATCTVEGSKSIHCSVCEETKDVTVIPATGHTVVIDSAAVAPTCTGTGLTAGSHCSVCDEVLSVQTEIPATGHTAVTDAEVAPTCTATGLTEGSHCSVCSEVLVAQTVIPATGHTPVTDAVIAATCTATGLTEGSHCAICDAVLVAQTVVPATGHTYGEWTVVTPATTTSTGIERRDCANCKHYETREIPMLCFVRVQSPSTTQINYGDTLVLQANIANGPTGSKIAWSVEGSGVEINPSADGSTCNVTSKASGDVTVTAKVVDSNGIPILIDGNEITATQNLTSKAGFFQKLISFIKNLFGANRIVSQAFDKVN